VPLSVTTDLATGGRWRSLRSEGTDGVREWLWHNPAVSEETRRRAAPPQAFVDAGGGEECLPSVVGRPEHGNDHGDMWWRSWQGSPSDAVVTSTTHGLTLRRRLGSVGGTVRADYQIIGGPGAGVLHAVHLLLDLSPRARIRVPGRPEVTIQDRPMTGGSIPTRWPDGDGVELDRCGPDDGTTRCAVVATSAVDVIDGEETLSLRWGAEADVPLSFVLWRNLGGWPSGNPYRSIGVEPMVGAATDAVGAAEGELALLDEHGTLEWWLEISATRSQPSAEPGFQDYGRSQAARDAD